jgi:ParB family chromosome partitioning protein
MLSGTLGDEGAFSYTEKENTIMTKKLNIDIPLAGVDALFTTQEQRDDEKCEKIVDVPIGELHDFKNHPFQVRNDDELRDLARSIDKYGVLMPLIARPRADGGYELISGHRRKLAASLAGMDTLPVIIRDIDDDTAVVMMVDSNKQRENLLPSEKAYAYKMKLEAIKRKAGRPAQENVGQLVPSFHGRRSTEIIGDTTGESYKQVQRYIRLTNLMKPLLDMVDEKRIAFSPAVELSYLPAEKQKNLLEIMEAEQCTPSLSQSVRLKRMSAEDDLTEKQITEIMQEQKANQRDKITLQVDRIKDYFPRGWTPTQMEKKIITLLDADRKRQQDGRERSHDRSDERER